MVSKTDGSGTTTFTYDEENRLKQVIIPSGPTVNYKYDGLGRRIERTTSGGANERYVYDGRDAIIDLNADWSVAATYLNAPGLDKHLRQSSTSSGVSYFLFDHLGSASALTGSSGNLLEQSTYDSFGNSPGSARTRYGYTGRERDSDTGMLYYRARFYDPQIGRFLSEDPIAFDGEGINLYGYVWNNPISYRDPLGLDGWGNDAADWLDRKIEVARRYWHYDNSEIIANGVNNTIGDLAHGTADILRVGSGLGNALYDPNDNPYGRGAGIAQDIARAAAIFNLLGGPAARFSGAGTPGSTPIECECPSQLKWPSDAAGMNDLLGMKGKPIPDTAMTPGRGKVQWGPSDNIKITFEQHPYHPNAPSWHRGPHWHLDAPGCRPHARFVPGDPLP